VGVVTESVLSLVLLELRDKEMLVDLDLSVELVVAAEREQPDQIQPELELEQLVALV